jgi:hypothetical protein
MSGHEFTTESARRAAASDELGPWISAFLASEGSDNEVLAEVLPEQYPCWIGPVELPLDQLNRLAGPADHPVLVEVEPHEWRDDVDDLAARIDDGFEPAPVVVTLQDDQLVVEDGNHRLEALRRAGRETSWSLVGFTDAHDRDRFILESEAAADAAPDRTTP